MGVFVIKALAAHSHQNSAVAFPGLPISLLCCALRGGLSPEVRALSLSHVVSEAVYAAFTPPFRYIAYLP